jgi:hypothetical protein
MLFYPSWRFSILLVALVPFFTCAAETATWKIEQMTGGTSTVHDGTLEILDAAGCTAWWSERLIAPIEITYEVTVVDQGGPQDRLSDLNCFWMAQDPRSSSAPFASGQARSGKFSDYDSLLTYYVGYGGNNNKTTRFRRYDGTAARPLLPEHDLSDKKFLLVPNHTYKIRLVASNGQADFYRDGEKVFSFRDPAPLQSGWFAIRTVRSHLLVNKLKIQHLAP